MKNQLSITVALVCLALVVASCGGTTSFNGADSSGGGANKGGGETPVTTAMPVTTESPTSPESAILFHDDFDNGTQDIFSNGDYSLKVVDNAMQMKVFTPNYFSLFYPSNAIYQNVHIEVTVKDNSTDSKTAYGFLCDRQSNAFYYLAITQSGQYAISKTTVDNGVKNDKVLTNNGRYGNSDRVPANAGTYTLGADCGDGTLTLYVNGGQVDSVSDPTYTNGKVALFVWSGDKPNSVDVSFDNFVITALK